MASTIPTGWASNAGAGHKQDTSKTHTMHKQGTNNVEAGHKQGTHNAQAGHKAAAEAGHILRLTARTLAVYSSTKPKTPKTELTYP